MPDLVATEAAVDKVGASNISGDEAGQPAPTSTSLIRNPERRSGDC